jgi:SAM-dependent methyltransferase
MGLITVLQKLRSAISGNPKATYCNVCDQPVDAFSSLPEFFRTHLREAGWPHPFEQSETCNADAYLCPHCSASDRDRLFALYLKEYISCRGNEPLRLLDFAPSQPLKKWLTSYANSTSIDLIYRSADLFAEDVDDKVDLMDMNIYREGQFEAFLCSHVLEHVVDDRKALREIFRVLEPGGVSVLLVPILLGLKAIDEDPTVTDPSERWRRFGQDDHVRLYSKAGFMERIREAGFQLHDLGVKHFGRSTFLRHGITTQSVLYIAVKPKRQ